MKSLAATVLAVSYRHVNEIEVYGLVKRGQYSVALEKRLRQTLLKMKSIVQLHKLIDCV